MTRSRSAEEVFGAQVRQARERRGWTQEQLAFHLRQWSSVDLSPTAMNRLELGKRPIRLNEVAALSELLELSLDVYSGKRERRSQRDKGELSHSIAKLLDREVPLQQDVDRARHQLEVAETSYMAARARYTGAVTELEDLREKLAQLRAQIAEYERTELDAVIDDFDQIWGADGEHQEAP